MSTASPARWPAPSGPALVGTRALEFVDRDYPSPYASDSSGRRLLLRVWYPAQSPTRRRAYFEGDEREAIGHRLDTLLTSVGLALGPACWDDLAERETMSHVDAPLASSGPHPGLVFSHGAMSYVGQSWLLAEHLASHGYVVISVAHPGGGVDAPSTGGPEHPLDEDFFETVGAGRRFDRAAQLSRLCGTVGERHAAMRTLIRTSGDAVAVHLDRWACDSRAVLDLIFAEHAGPAPELFGAVDRERVALAGFSFGGAATTLAAQRDERVRAAVNLDGAEWTGDLFGVAIRVPLLMLYSDVAALAQHYGVDRHAFYNEFFYEEQSAIGDRRDITRVALHGAAHMELTDLSLVDGALRAALAGGGSSTYESVLEPTADLVLQFLDHHLAGRANGWPEAVISRHDTVAPVSVAEAREWGRARGDGPADQA